MIQCKLLPILKENPSHTPGTPCRDAFFTGTRWELLLYWTALICISCSLPWWRPHPDILPGGKNLPLRCTELIVVLINYRDRLLIFLKWLSFNGKQHLQLKKRQYASELLDMQVVGIGNFGWNLFGTILTTFWVLSGNILKCKIHTTDWSYFTEALPETAGCVCLSDSDGDRLNTQFYCAQEDTCFSHQDISSVFQLNGQTWKCFF